MYGTITIQNTQRERAKIHIQWTSEIISKGHSELITWSMENRSYPEIASFFL